MQESKIKNKSDKIKKLCLAGVMAALYVCLDFLAVSVSAPFGGTFKISLSGLPIIIVSVFCGPWWGAATGFIGALIGQLVSYGFSLTTIFWILPAVARGISMGYLFRAFKKSTKFSIMTLEICISAVIVTALNTLAMVVDYAVYASVSSVISIWIALPSRLLAGVLTSVIFALMLPTIINSLKNFLKV